ncbi:type II and III secretion system protein family protein [Sphingobium chlorophenolicum]|uniref:type II and III secretion system protein family protein n=2 Tax=Sphingobium chlorophenolicum TaxID=46429 RepID=UPI0007882B1B|nr:pilus assembly protein N-terminal domain-containing protein [Sphingobium chlorophenolicum]
MGLASALPFAAGAETGLRVKEQRVLSYPRAIGRVEVDREGVLSVAAPSARSLRLTAIGAGEATVSVFGGDGGLIGQEAVRVAAAEARIDAPELRAGEQVVAVDVQFAAVSATTLKALGFNFSKLSGDIQGAIVSPSSLGSASFDPGGLSLEASAPIQNAFNLFLSAPNRGIGAVLSALSSNGLSQLLAQPTLLVRSGEQASFLAGGEFPVPVPQASGSGNMLSIQYKEFGVRLSVTPFVLSKDHIVLKIAPEVSELDYANGVQLQGYVVPGLRRRSAETTVELGSGQSFVIAGLSYSSQTVTKEKTPFLGDLPVLGAFFKRQQNQKEKQELIIVATPRLVTAVKPEEVPPLPGVAVDPGIGDMILGTDGLDQTSAPLGVVRR